MNDAYPGSDDAIPVLSDVVIPGIPPVATAAEPVSPQEPAPSAQPPLLAERLNALAAVMLSEMEHRIERMVEEELARAHAMAFETARVALQNRLRNELTIRLAALIEEVLSPPRT